MSDTTQMILDAMRERGQGQITVAEVALDAVRTLTQAYEAQREVLIANRDLFRMYAASHREQAEAALDPAEKIARENKARRNEDAVARITAVLED